ncbi:MAG: septum site-determining protein MinC [Candidatus Binatia bacterium]|nr:septum site-determining protein MinC [Candidatus Binatia bacterium]
MIFLLQHIVSWSGVETPECEGIVSGGGEELFTIKGLKGGPTFLFNDKAPFAEVIKAVEEELARANGFFRDSPAILAFGSRVLNKEEWRALKEILHREGLLLRYAVATEPTSRELLYKEGLPVRDSLAAAQETKKGPPTIKGSNALYLRRNLRSGQKEVFEGNVVLVGDVNQGAEILAGGDAIVFGTLRGVVHAGYPDNREAVVIALNLVPLQLRIGPFIGRADEGQNHRRPPQPEIARVKDERIVIEPYHGDYRRP